MTKESPQNHNNPALIKFVAPNSLKDTLFKMATERNVSLSAFLRIISSEYIKRNNHHDHFNHQSKRGRGQKHHRHQSDS